MPSTEPFWYDDPAILFDKDTWYKFVPTRRMSVAEALNAVVRFTLYFSMLLFLTSMRPLYLVFIPVVMAISLFLRSWFPQAKRLTEGFVSSYVGEDETRPTPDNPFMNPQLTDIHTNNHRPPAADITRKDVRDEVNRAVAQTNNIFMDTTDVFDLVQSQRNFHTVPEDDHAGLLRFLGKNAKSGKELNENYVVAKGTSAEFARQTFSPSGPLPVGASP